jgi:DNA-binding transcriptional LysR family regulator
VEWDKLRIFYYVGKYRNITKAADKLNVSQSAVSRSIKQLEQSGNCTFFHRISRGVALTQEGEILFETVEKMFITLETAKTHIEEFQELRGILKVATTVSLVGHWLVELIPNFLAAYPDIELKIIGNDEKLDMKTREVDVSIRPFMPDMPDLIQEYLYSCCMELYASPEYLQKYGVPNVIKDLEDHRLITFGESTSRSYRDIDWPLHIGMKEGEARNPYITINVTQAAVRLAETGIGIISLCKEFPHMDKRNLVPILPNVRGPIIDLYYTYPKVIKNSKKIMLFGKFLQSYIPEDHKIKEKIG